MPRQHLRKSSLSSTGLNVITLKPGASWFREHFSSTQSHENECRRELPSWPCISLNQPHVSSHVKRNVHVPAHIGLSGRQYSQYLDLHSWTLNAMLSSAFLIFMPVGWTHLLQKVFGNFRYRNINSFPNTKERERKEEFWVTGLGKIRPRKFILRLSFT